MKSQVRQNAETALQEAISRELAQGKTYEQLAQDFTRALGLTDAFGVKAYEVRNVHSGVATFGVKAARNIVKELKA